MIENLYGEAPHPPTTETPGDLSLVAQQANLGSPYAVRVAATLRLADLIKSGTHRLPDLAAAAGAHPDRLGRLMNFLIARGVFRRTAPDEYAMTESAKVLTSDHPMGVRAWLDLEGPAGSRMDACWTGLLDSVRTGEPAYPKIFGSPVWEDLEAHPETGAKFGELMAGRAASFVPEVVKGYDWEGIGHVVDVAGGTGLLLAELLQQQPATRGTLVDLPAVVPLARDRFAAAGITDRTEIVEGSMFDPLPAGGDLYILASIVHDWDDAEAGTILRRCAEAAGPGRRILVVDRTSDHGDPLTFTFMDLLMVVFLGGRERSLRQFAALGANAGLAPESASSIPCGLSLITFVVDGDA
jgi:hypothetical protein